MAMITNFEVISDKFKVACTEYVFKQQDPNRNNKKFWEELIAYFPWYKDRIENDVSNNSSIVTCVFVTAVTFLPSRFLATIGGVLPNRAVT
jgi:hypothetical protein